ncbi:DUF3426 domain-containing protein [Microbulbifer pacificus]|uniref:DUF3426 domain-containing protein n=1 Tax=Microbulbifer pacificus TaxID=407164 RepID=A0AAU0N3T4_9GAMM|nr:DUF3426 domain-containing protein [Microbulbifer pacificus]WOX06949.1 DUF3426 domain-containing protein [Microbulbifer pacificus]
MSQLVTRCPHCSTSFHVTEQQLRAARGAVRCGSCLQVFRADENIVFNEGDPQPASRKAIEELLDDDDFLIHDDIELEGEDHSDDELPRSRANKDRQPGQQAHESVTDQSPLIGDAFGEQQWQELDRDDAQQELDLHRELESELDELSGVDDDPWAAEIAREESSGVGRRKSDGHRDRELPEQREEDLFADDLLREQLGEPDDPLAEEEFPSDDFTAEDMQRIAGSGAKRPQPAATSALDPHQLDQAPLLPRDQLISAIGPAPIEVSWQPKRHRRVPNWLWVLGVLFMALGLAAQTAYFRFDTLSKRDPWRQLYAAACPALGCTLPAQVDITAIHTSNLVVRSHPQIANALAVEAVLLNRAPFDQPFPTLQLRFTDLKNAPVASRRFGPSDYLKGELSGRKLMPAGNPVHIALEIVDPGTEAVNYELRIAPQ